MITWDDNIWCSEELKPNVSKIKRRLKWKRKTVAANYCIALATNPGNMFDIYNMGELLFNYYRDSKENIHIVGLASGRDEACELVSQMIKHIYDTTGKINVREYFCENAEK